MWNIVFHGKENNARPWLSNFIFHNRDMAFCDNGGSWIIEQFFVELLT